MNYIRHLTMFYDKVIGDDRLNQSHISLYMSLFQLWNQNRFRNPVLICRSEVLQLSKIGSLNTYHKCLRDLNDFKYIGYEPSHNPTLGSKVNMYNFDTTDDTSSDTTSVQVMRRSRRKSDTTVDTGNEPLYINNTKHINKLCFLNSDDTQTENKNNIPENENSVLIFFKEESFPEIEAKRFYTYFQSKGWKIGENTPMEDWKAAARNWMLNSPEKRPNRTITLNTKKDYGEPL